MAPVTVIVVAVVLPAAMVDGLTDAMVGPITVNVLPEEEEPLEFCTVTLCGPAAASWAPVTVAVSEVALT